MEKDIIPRKEDGTFAPGHPGKKKGTLSKATRKLLELVEQEAGGVPLPVLMVRIGIRAADQGDGMLALAAFARAAQFVYSRPKDQSAESLAPVMLTINLPELPEEHNTNQ